MSQTDAPFLGDDSRRHCRGQIIDDDHHIDGMLIEEAVESRHHLTRDFIETRGVDPQEELRTGHLQVIEERRLQCRIVGRARIDQQTLSLSVITNRSHEGRYLYEIRPGTGQDTNSLLHLLTYFCAKIRN